MSIQGALINPQTMTVAVSGPDDANRLILCSGLVAGQVTTQYGGNQGSAVIRFLVGPALTRKQFVGAIASAGVAGLEFYFNSPPTAGGGQNYWQVASVDADWDDESGQVEVRVEAQVWSGTGTQLSMTQFSYHVSILACM